mgnify:FL=1
MNERMDESQAFNGEAPAAASGGQLLPELLRGFIVEVKGYLPKVQRALTDYQQRPLQTELLAEAQRHVRNLKGAAAVVGLTPLGDIAISVEEVLEKIANGQVVLNAEVLAALTGLLIQLEQYLETVANGTAGLTSMPATLAQALRALRHVTGYDAISHANPLASVRLDAPSVTPFNAPSVARFDAPSVTPFNAPPVTPFDAPSVRNVVPATPSPVPPVETAPAAMPDLSAWLDLQDDDELPVPALLNAETPPPSSATPPPSSAAPLPSVAAPLPEPELTAAAPNTVPNTVPNTGPMVAPAPPEPEPMPDIPAELLEVFLPEAEEHLRVMTLSLPALAAQPGNKALLQEIRRSAHSLKGSAAVVGFQEITKLAHRAEDLLDLLYEDELKLTPEHLQLLYTSTEALENLLNQRPDRETLQGLYEAYAEVLDAERQTGASAESAPARAFSFDVPTTAPAGSADAAAGQAERTTAPLSSETTETTEPASVVNRGKFVRVPIEQLDGVVKLVTELLVNHAAFEQNMTSLNRQLEETHANAARLGRVATKMEVQFEASTLGGRQTPTRAFSATALLGGNSNAPSFNLPGLSAPVLNQNTYGFDALEFDRYTEFHLLLRELTEAASDVRTLESELTSVKDYFQNCLEREARLCRNIQEQLMRLRMVPLSTLSSRLHRTAHTVATRRGKQVNFAIEGEETRLDKTVIEELADPLLHILRNAIDHGIETPAVREACGKPVQGAIRVRAYHEGTQTVIQIGDDGGGLDPDRLRQTAIKNGLLTQADAARISPEELYGLIFLPGFSTATEVSEISGRGVGMDVVKSTIHRLKGTVYVDSQPGAGTVFTMRLPMTLALTRALMVKTQQQTFAVPLAGLAQVVKLTPNLLERIGPDTVVRSGDKVYPLLQLSKLLRLPSNSQSQNLTQMALLMTIEDHQVAIAVDETLDSREIVVKNLGNHLRHVHGLTGATLLGDGAVVLILNVAELLRDVFRPRLPKLERAEARPVTVTPLPTPKASTPKPATPKAPAAKAVAAPLTVMVVDDSLSVRRVLSNRLTTAGWSPLQAKDGLDALEQLQHMTIPPDLLLVDIEMPRMDGYEFINTLRKQPEYADLPVIVLTSRAGQKHRDRAFEVGATDYLVKPYQDDVLLSLIRRLAQRT